MRLLPSIIIGLSIILAAVIWLAGSVLMPAGGSRGTVDNELRIEFEKFGFRFDELSKKVDDLENQIAALQSRPAPSLDSGSPTDMMALPGRGDQNAILDSYAQIVQVAARRQLNSKWKSPSSAFLENMFGRPAEGMTDMDGCGTMTNEDLSALLVEEDVGPIRVRMLKPAAESLAEVFARIKETDIDLYERISSAGSLCVRLVRGSTSGSMSAHAFGLAVDLNIDGYLDTLGDGKTQLGLTILADFFENAGWVWGAGFGREDSMHFEVSEEKLLEWRSEGLI